MPKMPLKPCAFPTCGKLTDNLTAADLGINENGVPYASETQDGIITKEMYQKLFKIINSDPSGITVEKVE